MGSGIAQVAAQAGASVIVFDAYEPALATGRKRVDASLAGLVRRGKLTVEDANAVSGKIRWTALIDDLVSAELVIEAIIEDEAVKRVLFADIERVVAPTAIIASNTSSLPISSLARPLAYPERFVGMHFFNPAQVMKLVEVVAGDRTAPQVRDTVLAAAKAWGKVGVAAADVPGFIVNRVARPFYAEAFAALGENAATPEVIDHLFRAGAGFRMGPLELTDLIGQDVNYAVARSIYDAYEGHTRFVPQSFQGDLVALGHLGQKSGVGVYDYGSAIPVATPTLAINTVAGVDRTTIAQLHDALGVAQTDIWIEIDGSLIGWGRGRSAQAEAEALGRDVALIDWTDGSQTAPLAFAASSDAAADRVVVMAAAADHVAFRIADRPGLLILRTLGQLANAACDAAADGVADEDGIDAAMRSGGNYPYGLFEWMDRYGRPRLARTLLNIADETGSALYSPSPYLVVR